MKKLLVAAVLATASVSTAAHAGGWIADNIIKPIAGEHAAREADKIHEQLGKPGDKIVDAAKTAVGAAAAGSVVGAAK
jgi:hypothetical protein